MVRKDQLNGSVILRVEHPEKLGGWCQPEYKYWRYDFKEDCFQCLTANMVKLCNCDSVRGKMSIVADTRYLRDVARLLGLG